MPFAAVRVPAFAADGAAFVARFAGAVFARSAMTSPTCKTARGGAPRTPEAGKNTER